MHDDYEEFAIHWVPQQGSLLAEFGVGWTGWCAERGMRSNQPEYRWMRRGRPEVPGTTALHGLHAPLKAPFRLAKGRSAWALDHDLIALAQSFPMVRLPRFELCVHDGRVVLSLARPCRSALSLIRSLETVVRPFEAEPGYLQYSGSLGVAGVDLPGMAAWTDFEGTSVSRFHVPLSDRMELDRAFDIVDTLTEHLSQVLREPHLLGDLALMGNPGRGRPWRLVERYALSDEPMPRQVPVPSGMACNGPDLIAPLNTGMAIV